MIVESSRLCPRFQKNSIMADRRICSRLSIGFASIPTRVNMLVTITEIFSFKLSVSSKISLDGTAKELRIDTGILGGLIVV